MPAHRPGACPRLERGYLIALYMNGFVPIPLRDGDGSSNTGVGATLVEIPATDRGNDE